MTLPFRYIEARHRLGLIDAPMEERLLAARRAFAAGLPPGLATPSSSTISALQQRRHPAGQHPVRSPGLRPGLGRGTTGT
jgi:hypothetical protein